MSKRWEPVEDGVHWNEARTRAVSIAENGEWLTTLYDYDAGCAIDLADGVRLMRQVESEVDAVSVPIEAIRELLICIGHDAGMVEVVSTVSNWLDQLEQK